MRRRMLGRGLMRATLGRGALIPQVLRPTAPRQSAALLREAAAGARSQKVGSLLTIGVIAALCATVLLTAGRTAATESAVLGSIDSSGTRSIVVRAQQGAGLDTSVLARLAHVDGIEWVAAFGPADDVTNAVFAGGAKVPMRAAYSENWAPLGDPSGPVASDLAARTLGFADRVGTAESVANHQSVDIAATLPVPGYLHFLEPLLIVPHSVASSQPSPFVVAPDAAPPTALPAPRPEPEPAAAPVTASVTAPAPATASAIAEPVDVLVVVAATPRQVGSVAAVVSSVLGVTDASTVTVTTSEQLAQLRATVGQQLGGFGQGLVESVFAATAVIVAAILSALVLLRRRDFGRRRALGASRSLIVQLLLTQVGLQAVAGSILGCVTTSLVLTAQDAPLPPPAFFAALALLAVVTALAAAAVPALIASRRDPLRELRVP